MSWFGIAAAGLGGAGRAANRMKDRDLEREELAQRQIQFQQGLDADMLQRGFQRDPIMQSGPTLSEGPGVIEGARQGVEQAFEGLGGKPKSEGYQFDPPKFGDTFREQAKAIGSRGVEPMAGFEGMGMTPSEPMSMGDRASQMMPEIPDWQVAEMDFSPNGYRYARDMDPTAMRNDEQFARDQTIEAGRADNDIALENVRAGNRMDEIEAQNRGALERTLADGRGGAPTEAEGKSYIYVSRGQSSLGQLGDLLTQHGSEAVVPGLMKTLFVSGVNLLTPGSNMGEALLLTPEQKLFRAAGADLVASILRKDSGAAITETEMDRYGSIFVPEMNDSDEVIAAKLARADLALQAIAGTLGRDMRNRLSAEDQALVQGLDQYAMAREQIAAERGLDPNSDEVAQLAMQATGIGGTRSQLNEGASLSDAAFDAHYATGISQGMDPEEAAAYAEERVDDYYRMLNDGATSGGLTARPSQRNAMPGGG